MRIAVDGINRVRNALDSVNLKEIAEPFCSRDPLALKMRDALKGDVHTTGNVGWQIPVILKGSSNNLIVVFFNQISPF
jgi:hypothetical protein